MSIPCLHPTARLTDDQGMGPPSGQAREDIDLRKPWKVSNPSSPVSSFWISMELTSAQADFRNLDSGAFISNIVSQGQDEKDLHLTFYFEWPFPKLEAGSKEEKDTSDRLWGLAKESVQATIDHTRKLVKEGGISIP